MAFGGLNVMRGAGGLIRIWIALCIKNALKSALAAKQQQKFLFLIKKSWSFDKQKRFMYVSRWCASKK